MQHVRPEKISKSDWKLSLKDKYGITGSSQCLSANYITDRE